MTNKKLLNILLYAGIAICLLQVWMPGHYLSCDGPSHLYNARIVHDMWQGSNLNLYARFYELVYAPDPNSLTTFLLASLLFVAKAAVAEKVFLSLYVLVFTIGFIALLRKLGDKNSYWLLVVFMFPFTFAFSKGFYNYSFSIAFFFWMVYTWVCYLERRNLANAIWFALFSALCYFTHLLPFVFGVFTCFSLLLSHTVVKAKEQPGARIIKMLLQKGWLLAAVVAPFILLALMFTGKEGGLQIKLGFFPYRLVELVEFKYIINVVEQERVWALIAGCVLVLMTAIVNLSALKKFTLHKYDGFVLSLALAAFVYLFFPEEFMGRLIIISIRVQLFVFLLVACCIAYRLPNGNVKNIGAAVLFLCFLVLSVYRTETRHRADEALNDYLSVAAHIEQGSVVLPFDFSPNGKDLKGKEIANRNSLFHHAAQYMGAEKPLIVLDNYEANMGYFPIRWKDATNPYDHLSRNEGIEGLPPFAQIASYKQRTGVEIDYVVLWCYDEAYLKENAHFKELYAEINSMYHLVQRTQGDRAILYARNVQ